MAEGPAKSDITLKNDERITKVGIFLRKSHLDELPQLVNVMRGEMSFVGPRPEIPKYTRNYDEKVMAIFLMPAGITSPASLLFADEARWLDTAESDRVYVNIILPRKNSMNIEYVKNFSVLNDIKVMIFTFFSPFISCEV